MINNAGLGPTTPFEEIHRNFIVKFLMLTLAAFTGESGCFETYQKKNAGKKGRNCRKIINASSQAGQVGNPDLAVLVRLSLLFAASLRQQQRIWRVWHKRQCLLPWYCADTNDGSIARKIADENGQSLEWGLQQWQKTLLLGAFQNLTMWLLVCLSGQRRFRLYDRSVTNYWWCMVFN